MNAPDHAGNGSACDTGPIAALTEYENPKAFRSYVEFEELGRSSCPDAAAPLSRADSAGSPRLALSRVRALAERWTLVSERCSASRGNWTVLEGIRPERIHRPLGVCAGVLRALPGHFTSNVSAGVLSPRRDGLCDIPAVAIPGEIVGPLVCVGRLLLFAGMDSPLDFNRGCMERCAVAVAARFCRLFERDHAECAR